MFVIVKQIALAFLPSGLGAFVCITWLLSLSSLYDFQALFLDLTWFPSKRPKLCIHVPDLSNPQGSLSADAFRRIISLSLYFWLPS